MNTTGFLVVEITKSTTAPVLGEDTMSNFLTEKKCPDCRVSPGERHEDGCDVARCSLHGKQYLFCQDCLDEGFMMFSPQANDVMPTIWTGEWPGVEECREMGLYVYDFPGVPGKSEDLNRLAIMGLTGEVVWSVEKERWIRP